MLTSYQFPPDIQEHLKARLSEGQYQSEDGVLRDAMDALDQLEQDKFARWRDRTRLAVERMQSMDHRSVDQPASLRPVVVTRSPGAKVV